MTAKLGVSTTCGRCGRLLQTGETVKFGLGSNGVFGALHLTDPCPPPSAPQPSSTPPSSCLGLRSVSVERSIVWEDGHVLIRLQAEAKGPMVADSEIYNLTERAEGEAQRWASKTREKA